MSDKKPTNRPRTSFQDSFYGVSQMRPKGIIGGIQNSYEGATAMRPKPASNTDAATNAPQQSNNPKSNKPE